jgi:hypothetical protein
MRKDASCNKLNQVVGTTQEAEARAQRVAAWQADHAAAQQELAATTAALAAASSGVRLAVDAATAAQERTAAAVSALLGNAVSWSDVAFYGGGVAFAAALAWPEGTRAAAAPAAAALAAAYAAERGLLLVATDRLAVRAHICLCFLHADEQPNGLSERHPDPTCMHRAND